MCEKCAAFIADVALTEAEQPADPKNNETAPDSGATIRISNSVAFCDQTGAVMFRANDGDIIGRHGAGAEYLAQMPTVSRRHCQLSLGVSGWTIEDLNSVNGTWINGARIGGPAALANGDAISLSKACELRVKL